MNKPLNTPAASAPGRLVVRLGDLGVAPENLRAQEPADEAVPRLAETIRAAGMLYPLVVRRGRRGESPFMVLDGRRRRFALLLLADRGERTLDDEVECVLARGRAAEAAAAILPASEQAPVHLADVIAAVGKLRRSKLDTRGIAAALGYDELEIRRLEALSGVHPKALQAFRLGKVTLRALRLFARVADVEQQAEIAEMALDGYFPEHRLQQLVRQDRATADGAHLPLVGRARYAEAGGRVSVDLFGEMPDVLLDAELLGDLWAARAKPFGAALAAAGLEVYAADDCGFGAPDGQQRLPYVHETWLPDDRKAAYRDAVAAVTAARAAIYGLDLADPASDPAIAALLEARLREAQAGLVGGDVSAVFLYPCAEEGVGLTFFCRMRPAEPDVSDDDDDVEDGEVDREPEPPPPAVLVDVDGVTHGLHQARTDMATRGLARAVCDHPAAALTACVAQLFKHVALRAVAAPDSSAAAIVARGYRGVLPACAALDGHIAERLAGRREAFLASGLRPIPWVDGLPFADKLNLLAELTAACLDLREPRTDALRPQARAEATEIAMLCGADITRHWAPDRPFLDAHSKPQLLAMLAAMEAADPKAALLKKAELVDVVAAAAAERRWAPPQLQWRTVEPAEAATEESPAGEAVAA